MSGATAPLSRQRCEDLVTAAGRGERSAWEELVHAYAGLVWGVARDQSLTAQDAADVSQGTWLGLVDNLGRLEDPGRLDGWLAETARQQCVVVARRPRHGATGPVEPPTPRPPSHAHHPTERDGDAQI